MAAALVKFLRGSYANYKALTPDANSIYITTDEGGIYLGSQRLGDYVMKNTVEDLPASAHENALYYVKNINVLCRWDVAQGKWVQINAAGLVDIVTEGSGNVVSGVSVVDAGAGQPRKLKITYTNVATTTEINGLKERVQTAEGAITTLNDAATVEGSVAHAVKTLQDTLTPLITAAQNTADGAVSVNGTQNNKISALEEKMGAAEGNITNLQTAVTTLNGDANTDGSVAKSIKTESTRLEGLISEAKGIAEGAVSVNNTQNGKITALEGKMSAAEGNITNLQTALNNLQGDGEGSIADQIKDESDALKLLITAAQSTADGAVSVNNTQNGKISSLEGRMATAEGEITTLKGDATTEGSVRKIVADAIATIIANDSDAMDSITDIVTWVTSHSESAAAMDLQVQTNKNDITGLKGRMDTAEGKITTLEGSLEDLIGEGEGSIAEQIAAESTILKGLITAAQNTADEAVSVNTTQSGKITTLEEKMGAAEGNITTLQGNINTLNGNADTVGSVAHSIKTESDTLKDLITAAKGIAEGAVSVNTTQNGEITTLKTKMGDAESNITKLQTDLQAEISDRATDEAAIVQSIEDLTEAVNSKNTSQDNTIAAIKADTDRAIIALTWEDF